MTTGRPPTPIEQKQRRGTLRKDRMPPVVGNLAVVPAADPDVLDGLGPVGRAFLDAGAHAWLAKTDQLGLLRLIEHGWTEYESLRSRWIASDYSNLTVAKRLGQVEENLTKWLSLAGLTPTDRSRLGVAAVKAETTLERLRRSRDGRPSTERPSTAETDAPSSTPSSSRRTAASSRTPSAGRSAASSASDPGSGRS